MTRALLCSPKTSARSSGVSFSRNHRSAALFSGRRLECAWSATPSRAAVRCSWMRVGDFSLIGVYLLAVASGVDAGALPA
jgi:hypothetical protein